MIAYQMKNRLNILTLAGYDDGEYQWIGKEKDWREVELADRAVELSS